MILPKALSIYILLLSLDITSAKEGRFSRTLRTVKSHSRTLAKDLRIAFSGVLVARQQSPLDSAGNRVIYCKSNGGGTLTEGNSDGGGGGGGGGSGNETVPSGTSISTPTSGGSPAPSASAVDTPWKLIKEHAGESFFNDWDFWTDPDPTHGTVDYISEADGRSAGLVEVNDAGNAIMRVETTETVSDLRRSTRIHTKDSYNHFLLIMDAVHMPYGCGTWPAFWTNGPGWPLGGEIDILEGVHDHTRNQVALHTDIGCRIDGNAVGSAIGSDGTVLGTNCAAFETGNAGCGIRSNSDRSYGKPFNDNGGGVYATLWDDSGISVWFFERDEIPADIEAGTPLPALWNKRPDAVYPASGCDPDRFFYDNVAIFDTTFCGDWAGSAWTASGIPGQEQSCAARTGVDDCATYVRTRGSTFEDAYWEVRYVRFYQT